MHYVILLDGPRPTEDQVRELRGYMLAYVKQVVLKGIGVHEDELQAMLNFLTTVHEVSRLTDEGQASYFVIC